MGVLILTHRRLLVKQFERDLTAEGYGDRFRPAIEAGKEPLTGNPITIQTYAWFARHVGSRLPHGLSARHLRRGAHRARREDQRRDPKPHRARVYRDDGHRAADREAGLGCVPGLGRRFAARRRGAARPDRTATVPARPACGRDLVGTHRGRRLRPGDPGQGPRPRADQSGRRELLPRSLRQHARHRLRGRGRARLQPGAGVPRRRAQGRGRERPDATAQAGRDPRGLRARRDQHARERTASGRGLELASRDHLHAPGADRKPPCLSAANRPDHANAPAQGSGDRRRLHRSCGDAQRSHDHAPHAARLRFLPPGRAGHTRAAPPGAAPGQAEALAGSVAHPGHPGPGQARRRDHPRVGAGRSGQARRRRAAVLGHASPAASSVSTSASSSPRSLRRHRASAGRCSS